MLGGRSTGGSWCTMSSSGGSVPHDPRDSRDVSCFSEAGVAGLAEVDEEAAAPPPPRSARRLARDRLVRQLRAAGDGRRGRPRAAVLPWQRRRRARPSRRGGPDISAATAKPLEVIERTATAVRAAFRAKMARVRANRSACAPLARSRRRPRARRRRTAATATTATTASPSTRRRRRRRSRHVTTRPPTPPRASAWSPSPCQPPSRTGRRRSRRSRPASTRAAAAGRSARRRRRTCTTPPRASRRRSPTRRSSSP